MSDKKRDKKASRKPHTQPSQLRAYTAQKRPPNEAKLGFWKDVSGQYYRKIGPSEFADTIESIVKNQESTHLSRLLAEDKKKNPRLDLIDTS